MKALKWWLAPVVLGAVVALSGCGDSATSKLADQIKTTHALNGKQVEMVGYLKPTRFTLVRNGFAPLVLVPSSTSDPVNATLENIMLAFGKEANSIFMPERYKSSEIELRDAAGKVHSVDTQFKITGTLHYDSTEKIAEPQPPTGNMVLGVQRQNYEKAKAEYEP